MAYCGTRVSIVCVGVKRGPKFGPMRKVHVFVLSKHNDDFLPSPSEQARLSRNGMGMHPLYHKIGILKTFCLQLLSINNIYLSSPYGIGQIIIFLPCDFYLLFCLA